MKVISVLNQKGGSGKSTISQNIAIGLARAGEKILLIDTDPQKTTTMWNSLREDDLDVLVLSIEDPKALKKSLQEFKPIYNRIIIDGCASENKTMAASIISSDFIIIPLQPTGADFWSTETLEERILEAKEIKDIEVRYLFTRFPTSQTLLSRDITDLMQDQNFEVLETKVFNRIAYADAMTSHKSVYEWNDAKAKDEIEGVIQEIKGLCR